MSRIGIAISGGPNPAEMIDLVVLAESLGYESAWIAEGHGGDQFAILAACATRTSRILLGTSISSVFVRAAPTIAMAASTIADISGGRFILGLGSSHKVQVEPEHGVAYGKPLTRTRDTVAIVRELIHEGRVRFEGRTIRIENFELWYAPRRREVPVSVGRVPKRDRTMRRSRRRHHPDAQHIAHGRFGPGATGRSRTPGRTRPG